MGQLIRRAVGAIEQATGLDKVSGELASQVQAETEATPVRNALSGGWLGHPLHPVITDLPIGAWAMASAFDLTAGREGADGARRLVGLGVLCALPAAATGASDWSTTYGPTQRVGLVHGALNGAATTLQLASWVVRGRGHRATGAALSTAALGLTVGAAYLGGHLTLVRGVGVNHDAFAHPKRGWTDVAAASDLAVDTPLRVMAGTVPVVLVRHGDRDYALSATCDHAGGPLDEGRVEGECIRCPWHGSEFRLADGGVVRGPASVAQPAWEVRTSGDRIEVRPAR